MTGSNSWNDAIGYEISMRAYLLYTEGRYRDSLTLFEGLQEIYPENLYYQDVICALYLALQTPHEAVRCASDMLFTLPDHIPALVKRCEGYLLLGMEENARGDIDRLRVLQAYSEVRLMELRLAAVIRKQYSQNRQTADKAMISSAQLQNATMR